MVKKTMVAKTLGNARTESACVRPVGLEIFVKLPIVEFSIAPATVSALWAILISNQLVSADRAGLALSVCDLAQTVLSVVAV